MSCHNVVPCGCMIVMDEHRAINGRKVHRGGGDHTEKRTHIHCSCWFQLVVAFFDVAPRGHEPDLLSVLELHFLVDPLVLGAAIESATHPDTWVTNTGAIPIPLGEAFLFPDVALVVLIIA